MPVTAPALAPAPSTTNPGVLNRFREIVRRVKASPGYTVPIGEALGIIGADSEEPDPMATAHARLEDLVREAAAAQAEGRREQALELYDAALDKARAIHAAEPNQPSAQLALAGALTSVAALEEADSRLEAALPHQEEAVALRRSVCASAPEAPEPASGLVEALGRLADIRAARGDRGRAQDHYAEGVKIAERMAWLKPYEARYAELLARIKARHAALEGEPEPQTEPTA